MTVTELTHDQKLALVALVEAAAMADGRVDEGEEQTINVVASELGDEQYRALLDESDSRFEDMDDLKAYLGAVEDQPVRELIYGLVMDEIRSLPSEQHSETELLEWLAATWSIEVSES